MLKLRRHNFAPRVELLPLIDIVFLLLTFFIYSMLVLFPASALNVSLLPVAAGEQADPGNMRIIQVAANGSMLLENQPVTQTELNQTFAEIGSLQEDEQPRFFIVFETPNVEGPAVDRVPLLLKIMASARKAGVAHFEVVGPPEQQANMNVE